MDHTAEQLAEEVLRRLRERAATIAEHAETIRELKKGTRLDVAAVEQAQERAAELLGELTESQSKLLTAKRELAHEKSERQIAESQLANVEAVNAESIKKVIDLERQIAELREKSDLYHAVMDCCKEQGECTCYACNRDALKTANVVVERLQADNLILRNSLAACPKPTIAELDASIEAAAREAGKGGGS